MVDIRYRAFTRIIDIARCGNVEAREDRERGIKRVIEMNTSEKKQSKLRSLNHLIPVRPEGNVKWDSFELFGT
jgi:hypothetical protein